MIKTTPWVRLGFLALVVGLVLCSETDACWRCRTSRVCEVSVCDRLAPLIDCPIGFTKVKCAGNVWTADDDGYGCLLDGFVGWPCFISDGISTSSTPKYPMTVNTAHNWERVTDIRIPVIAYLPM